MCSRSLLYMMVSTCVHVPYTCTCDTNGSHSNLAIRCRVYMSIFPICSSTSERFVSRGWLLERWRNLITTNCVLCSFILCTKAVRKLSILLVIVRGSRVLVFGLELNGNREAIPCVSNQVLVFRCICTNSSLLLETVKEFEMIRIRLTSNHRVYCT